MLWDHWYGLFRGEYCRVCAEFQSVPTEEGYVVARLQLSHLRLMNNFFFFQAEDGIRDIGVTGVQTCALPILCCAESLWPQPYFSYPPSCHSRQPRRRTPPRPPHRPRSRLPCHRTRSSRKCRWTPRPRIRWRSTRSEERRVGKEGSARVSPGQ